MNSMAAGWRFVLAGSAPSGAVTGAMARMQPGRPGLRIKLH